MEPVASRAVFLSYASQDVEPARRIADALRAFGVEVWFDQSELRGGDAWDQKIRKQIHECALVLPIISTTTQERSEGYFRREWKLAVERTHDMAEGVPFIVPIAVDDVPEASALVPEPFLRVQWTRLPHGVPSPQFVEQVKRLLVLPHKPLPEAGRHRSTQRDEDAASVAAGPRQRVMSVWFLAALAVMVLAGIAAVFWVTRKSEPTAPPKVAAETAPMSAAVVNDKSIAVLPFANMGDEKGTGVFADGVHEDVLTSLQNVRELRVVSRQSVEQYRKTEKTSRQIGQELGVAYLLEGSVRREGNTVRVTGQLIDARTEAHIWASSYDRELRDIFAIQSELAQTIAGELKVALSPEEKKLLERRPTENLAAYDLFLKARDSLNREGFGPAATQRQETLLQSAVTLDPTFAAAWAHLAGGHVGAYFLNYDHTEARRAKAKAAMDTAVRLAPDAPETLLALSGYSYGVLHDVDQSDKLFEQYARLQPNNAEILNSRGEHSGSQGRWAESADYLRKATKLDPGCYLYAYYLQWRLQECRHYNEAIEEQRRIVGLQPNSDSQRKTLALLPFVARGSTKEMDDWLAGWPEDKAKTRSFVQIRKDWARARGDFAEAIRLDRLQPYSGDNLLPIDKEPQAFEAAVTLAASGDMTGARARLEDLPARIRAQLVNDPDNADLLSRLGRMEALLGNKEEAVRCGRRAVELLPASLHRYWHAVYTYRLAVILAWVGDKDGAIDEFAHLMRSEPTVVGMSVYHLKFGPWAWPIRDDLRWEALLDDPKNNAPLF